MRLKQHFHELPIRKKLQMIILLSSSLVLILTSIAFVILDMIIFHMNLIDEISSIARFVGNHNIAALDFEDRRAANQSLAIFVYMPYVKYAYIYDHNQKIFAEYHRQDLKPLTPYPAPNKNGFSFTQDGLIVFQSIQSYNTLIGIVMIQVGFEHLFPWLVGYICIVGIIMFLAFAITKLIASYFAQRISEPILQLTDTARSISKLKDYSIRACNLCSNDETAILINGFNTMLGEIQKRDKELADYREHLEAQVAERTDELASSRDLLQLIMDTLPAPIYYKDLHQRFMGCNKAFQRWTGMSIMDIEGKTSFDVWPLEYAELFHKIECSLFKDKSFVEYETQIPKKDGTWVNVIIYYTAFNLKTNCPLRGIVGAILDMSEVKRVQEQLRHAKEDAEAANRAKSEFLANMSHEIRTPLNAVLGFSELLGSLLTNPKEKRYIEAIQSSGKNLLMLINDILDLSKIEAGKLELNHEPIRIRNIISDIPQVFSLKLEEKKLHFILEMDDTLPHTLIADEIRLRQVLINLVGNAVKFTHTGHIRLAVKKCKEVPENKTIDIMITVEDTGIGIDPTALNYIFDAFRQQDGQSTKKYGGTGLGLSITKRLIEMMNGKIYVESQLNVGSRFDIYIPAISYTDIPNETVLKEEVIIEKNMIFEPATILVVDDIDHNRQLIKEYLQNMPIQVIEAAEGEQAIFLTKNHKPNLILMDIRMPGMDGYATTRMIKNDIELNPIPIIALTASAMTHDKEQILQMGFDGFLSKPLKRIEFLKELSNYLKHSLQSHESQADAASRVANTSQTESHHSEYNISERLLLSDRLEHECLNQWQEAKESGFFDQIASFAQVLKELGQHYHESVLVDYGETLFFHANQFDIKQMNIQLNNFPKLIQTLKPSDDYLESRHEYPTAIEP